MSRRRRRQSAGVPLPWEGRRAWLTRVLSRRRFGPVIAFSLLALGVSSTWRLAKHRGRVRSTRAAIAEVHRAIGNFRAELGRCPRSTVELVHPPKAGAKYLEELPSDGWGRPLMVRCPGRSDAHGADVISSGPSGSFSTDDNIL